MAKFVGSLESSADNAMPSKQNELLGLMRNWRDIAQKGRYKPGFLNTCISFSLRRKMIQ